MLSTRARVAAVAGEQVVVHRDEEVDAHLAREPRGLALVQVADDASGLALRIAAVDRQHRDVDPHVAQPSSPCPRSGSCRPRGTGARRRRRRTKPRNRISPPDSSCPNPYASSIVTPCRAGTGWIETRDLEVVARLHADDPIRPHARLRHHVDDRRRNDEHGAGRGGRDRRRARRVEVVDVLVADQHEVDGRRLATAAARSRKRGRLRGQERVDEGGRSRRPARRSRPARASSGRHRPRAAGSSRQRLDRRPGTLTSPPSGRRRRRGRRRGRTRHRPMPGTRTPPPPRRRARRGRAGSRSRA